jgi:hypothetical protein
MSNPAPWGRGATLAAILEDAEEAHKSLGLEIERARQANQGAQP